MQNSLTDGPVGPARRRSASHRPKAAAARPGRPRPAGPEFPSVALRQDSHPEHPVTAGDGRGAIVSLDPSWRILTWNKDAETLFGFPHSAVRGMVLPDVLRMRDPFGNPVACFCGMLQVAKRGEAVKPFVVEVTTQGGDLLRVVVNTDPDARPGRPHGLVCRFRPDNRRRHLDRRGLDPGTLPLHDALARGPARPRGVSLSPAELKVLRLLASGKRADEVAETLCNSVLTVRNHIQRILRKLDAHSQAQAISVALRTGLV